MTKFFGIIVGIAAAILILSFTLGGMLNEILPDLDLRWFIAAAALSGLMALVASGFALVDRWDRARQAKAKAKR